MHEEIIFHGSLVQYWGVIVAIWESAIGGDKCGIEPFEIPKTYRADRLPDNIARVQIWWEQAGIEIGSVIAITRPDSAVKLIVNINDDAEDAQLKWLGVKNKLQTDGWIGDQNQAGKTLDYFRPAGYEIQADNTGGTAIYKRDQLGNISEAKFAPNPGWVFEVGQKSITIHPEHIQLKHTMGNFQPDSYPSSATDSINRVMSETLAGLTENVRGQDSAAKPEKPEPNGEPVKVRSERIQALNTLAVLWVTYNQTQRISKDDGMEWFISENAKAVGLAYLTVAEFKKHLPKAYKAGVIDKDSKTGRFIPKLVT